ncbi:hypothetical protein C8R44DRAFT_730770 [Mycena epipterygia]|nr:hypothetical protein C8R44DRAFT_730770 [Mycena epipterygia]
MKRRSQVQSPVQPFSQHRSDPSKLNEDSSFIIYEPCRAKFADADLTSTEFVTAREALADAIKHHFEPKDMGAMLSKQLLAHFITIRHCADFEANFAWYKAYHVEVKRVFLESSDFDWSEWQDKIWKEGVEKDRDRLLHTTSIATVNASGDSSKRNSFQTQSPSCNSFRPPSQPLSAKNLSMESVCIAPAVATLAPNALNRRVIGASVTSATVLSPQYQTSSCAGNSIVLAVTSVATAADSATPALSAVPARKALLLPGIRPRSTLHADKFPIITPLKANRWEHFIARIEWAEEYADVLRGIREGFTHGFDTKNK